MDINLLIEREKPYIEKICKMYQYDSNIEHILLILIPAFILKYGFERESLIQNTFRDIKIISSDKESSTIRAYYTSTLNKSEETYKTRKYMVIQNYNKISLVELIDNLTHEFNHAINSYLNEIRVSKKYVYLRTGLTYRIYDKETCSFIKKDNSYILEEIINTKQTEDIINIIKKLEVNDSTIQNTIYGLNSETNTKYNSNSYYLQSNICKKIIDNRTFIRTLERLRLTGDIYDIEKWFDDIIGEDNKYKEFITLLNEIYELELSYHEKKLFKNRIINKIRNKTSDLLKIIEKFNENVNLI